MRDLREAGRLSAPCSACGVPHRLNTADGTVIPHMRLSVFRPIEVCAGSGKPPQGVRSKVQDYSDWIVDDA